jgi:hypothetical protein
MWELIYINKRGEEACYGEFDDQELAIVYQQWLEYLHGRICWLELT